MTRPLKRIFLGSVALTLAGALPAAGQTPVPAPEGTMMQAEADSASINAPFNTFLERYLTMEDGIALLRYGDVTMADKEALGDYITALEEQRPSAMGRDAALAYWFNLYNAKTIEIVLDAYPVSSIRKIGGNPLLRVAGAAGPWKDEVLTVEGRRLSLDNVEHDIVREDYDEPRVHYAFNCASIGCPNLKASAWEAASLEEDLDAAARAYVNHPRGVSLGNRITASSIYDWFQEDFGGTEAGVLEHLVQYADADKAEALRTADGIDGYAYDWSLNEAE